MLSVRKSTCLTLRTQVSSLVPEGSKKRKSYPFSLSALNNVCYSKMFQFVSALLNSEGVNLPSLRLKLTLQQSLTKLYFLYFVSFFKCLGYINTCNKLYSWIPMDTCETKDFNVTVEILGYFLPPP